jgi:hypothetical protein
VYISFSEIFLFLNPRNAEMFRLYVIQQFFNLLFFILKFNNGMRQSLQFHSIEFLLPFQLFNTQPILYAFLDDQLKFFFVGGEGSIGGCRWRGHVALEAMIDLLKVEDEVVVEDQEEIFTLAGD